MRSRNVARELIHLIESGEIAVGTSLPPTRALASRFGVSLNTVQVAIKELQTLQMIDCLPRQRSVVKSSSIPFEQPPHRQVKQIAIVVPTPPDSVHLDDGRMPWTMQIIHAMEQTLFETDYAMGLVLIPAERDAKDLLQSRLNLFGSALAGVLCFSNATTMSLLDEFEQRGLPWIAIGRPGPEINHNFVATDNHHAGRLVGSVFAQCGFERVLLLANSFKSHQSDLEKSLGFFQGYLERGAATHCIRTICCENWQEASGYHTIRDLVTKESYVPQAIFAKGDLLALGAMRALNEAGLRVPHDVSVVGATGLPSSQFSHPPLTVVTQPMAEIGRQAAQMVVEMAREGTRRVAGRRIPGQFIMRESFVFQDAQVIQSPPDVPAADLISVSA